MKKNKRILLFALPFVSSLLVAGLVVANTINVKANESSSSLSFTSENWVVEGNSVTLSNSSEITFNKDVHVGENKAVLHTTQDYTNYHLSFNMKFDSMNCSDPWFGRSGIIFHSDDAGLDGYYLGFFNWDNNRLWASSGWYVDDTFHLNGGVDAGWGDGQGIADNQYDIYVQNGHMQIIINNWVFMNAPLPYKTTGGLTLVSDGFSATYKDFTVTPLADDFELSERLVRPNWGGSNLSGSVYYWFESGKDQMFRMSLPEDVSNIKTYYLARGSKTRDKSQNVDVYLDKTGTLTMSDTWDNKTVTWGDAPSYASDFGTSMVEIPKSYFEGCTNNQTVGFYLDKNVDGWYSAINYYLLYEDTNGVLRVSDFLDLSYQFDKDAHAYSCATPSSDFHNYNYFDKDAGLITTHYKGQEVEMIQLPDLYKKEDIVHNFDYKDGPLSIDMNQYLKVNKNYTSCVVKYSVDGGPLTDTVTLENKNASGVVTAVCQPSQLVIDGGGWVYFDDIRIDIPYTTSVTLPDLYLNQERELNLFVDDNSTTIDLLNYVSTNMEGTFSYTYNGQETQGTLFTVPNKNLSSSITLTAKHELGDKTVTLPLTVTSYTNPSTLSLPHRGFDGFVPLNGAPEIVNNTLTSSSTNNWDVLADVGVNDYVLQSTMCPSTDGGQEGTYGILIHASMSPNGLNGTLLGFDSNNGAIDVSVGYLTDGVYTHDSSFSAGFGVSADYPYKFVVQGSSIVVMINGYRIFEFSDSFYSGSKIAILNNSGTITYKDVKVNAFNDDISTYAIRKQWAGIDTYAKVATLNGEGTIEFNVPNASNATNFRLVRRTSLWETSQGANISIGGNDYGTWTFNYADLYGDIVYPLNGFATTDNKVTVKISPSGANVFKASYVWLIYTIDGVDYVADSVYLGNEADAKRHNVTGSWSLSGVEKCFIINNNGMLLTVKSNEKVVWAQDPFVTDKMEAKTYEDASISSSIKLPYRLYLPANYDANKKYPVLVYMHGAGERGNDNLIQVTGVNHHQSTHLLLNRVILGEYADDFIVVAPQCPNDMRWVESDWTSGKYNLKATATSIPTQLLISLLYNDIFKNYSVNLSQVYGAGLSMGGFGVTDLAMREPGLFAAIVNCAGGADASQYELLKSTAVRVYHSDSDTTVNNDETLALVNALKTANADAEYYEVNHINHESWIVGFEDADLMTWMLSKQKSWSIKVETNGGTFTQELPETYTYEDKTIKLEDANKDGYSFAGWYLDSKFDHRVEEISLSEGKNIELYAKFVQQLKVEIFNEDVSLDSLKVNTGDVIDLSTYAPTKEGHILIGYTDGTNNYAKNAKVTVIENMTLTARWQIMIFEVTFVDGDETLQTVEVNYGEKVVAIEAPTKEGYVFKGWALNDSAYDFESAVKGELTLKAIWEKGAEEQPSEQPSEEPSEEPSDEPTVEPSETPSDEPSEPQEPTKKGCRGASVGLIGLLALAGTLLISKKRK